MKTIKHLSFIILLLLAQSCATKSTETLRMLQLNIWHEGRSVEGGFNGIVDQIIASNADIVTLCEINNAEDTRFCDRLVQALADKGQTYYMFYSTDSGILSRYPFKSNEEVFNAGNNITKGIVEIEGREYAIYSAHLDYLHCSYYLAKGYDGSTWKKIAAPITDVDSILRDSRLSTRDEAIAAFWQQANNDIENNRVVLLGGDFNEPSHLDWGANTKDLYDHNGLVIPWEQSTFLYSNGFADAYRVAYPDPVTHPGFTYPAFNPAAAFEKLVWAPEMDERERIDFIYYRPADGWKLKSAVIWGPDESVCKNQRIKETSADPFKIGEGVWPTDHKGLLVELER